jgi:transglutaminase-like putative cysteine protease
MTLRLARTVVALAVVLFAFSAAAPAGDEPLATRQFEVSYQVRVPALPAGSGPLRLWIPVPQSDRYQTITALRIESPVKYKVGRDAEYGNQYARFDVDAQYAASGFEVLMRFQVARREHRVELAHAPAKAEPAGPLMARYLRPDTLVPLDSTIGELSKEQTQGVTDPLQKGRKVYEYVVATMRYDKSGQGWGRGDAIWACTAKRGNCTDFHSLFIGMMRASGVPARFEMGFPLPADKSEGDISGYHCWAQFYVQGFGWVPVDASEAWKNPAKHDYFFGAHDTNSVQFTIGRDIRLGPEQKGDPLNYFIYPYAEVDGKPFSQLQTHFGFRDLPPGPSKAQAAGY